MIFTYLLPTDVINMFFIKFAVNRGNGIDPLLQQLLHTFTDEFQVHINVGVIIGGTIVSNSWPWQNSDKLFWKSASQQCGTSIVNCWSSAWWIFGAQRIHINTIESALNTKAFGPVYCPSVFETQSFRPYEWLIIIYQQPRKWKNFKLLIANWNECKNSGTHLNHTPTASYGRKRWMRRHIRCRQGNWAYQIRSEFDWTVDTQNGDVIQRVECVELRMDTSFV